MSDENITAGSRVETILAAVLFFVLAFCLYWNVLHGEFISDDYVTIVGNPSITGPFDVSKIWQAFNTRFLTGLTFKLNFLAGGLNPSGFHVVNVILHALNALMVYLFTRGLFQTPVLKEDFLPSRNPGAIALFAGLIFLCHPIQTQAVSFITQRAVEMATLFYLLTLVCYLRVRLGGGRLFYAGGVFSLLTGLFCKEMILTLPAMLLILEFYFFNAGRGKIVPAFKRFFPFAVITATLPLVLMMDRSGSVLELKGQIVTRQFSWPFFLTELNVLRTYLRLLFLPVHQAHEYAYPLVRRVFELRTVFSVAVLGFTASLVPVFFNRRRLISFAVLWFFVTVSVEAIVVSFVNRGVIYEHWLYLPMVGFAVFLSVLTRDIFRREWVYRAAVGMILLIFSALSLSRNFVWQDEIRFWEDGIRKAPQKATVYFAAGKAYQRKGRYSEALERYLRSAELFKNGGESLTGTEKYYASSLYNNLGVVYSILNRDEEGFEAFAEALKYYPGNADVWHNRGMLFYYREEYASAAENFRASLGIQRNSADSYYYFGLCLARSGQTAEARDALKKGLKLYQSFGNRDQERKTRKLLQSF